MSVMLATSLLMLLFILLLGLPLIPAGRELFCKSDHAPLQVVQQHAGDVRFFAEEFRRYLAPILLKLDEPELSSSDTPITMPDGTPCLVFARRPTSRNLGLDQNRICTKLVVSLGDAILPAATNFEREIYVRRSLWGGIGNQYKALLGEGDVHLAEETVVTRWAHAVGEIDCASSSRLYGRVSSDRAIRLRAGCYFTRVHAPCIAIGVESSQVDSTAPAGGPTEIAARILHNGDLQVPPGEVVAEHLVVRGKLSIGAGARMLGNVKAHKNIFVEPGVIVHGSLISASELRIGTDCRMRGPVIAERAIVIARGARAGSLEAPTTVSAPEIEIAEGAMVFGTLWARKLGHVGIGK